VTYGYSFPDEMTEAITGLQERQHIVPENRVRLNALYRQQGFVKGFKTQIYRDLPSCSGGGRPAEWL
jgi:hypothetical protein